MHQTSRAQQGLMGVNPRESRLLFCHCPTPCGGQTILVIFISPNGRIFLLRNFLCCLYRGKMNIGNVLLAPFWFAGWYNRERWISGIIHKWNALKANYKNVTFENSPITCAHLKRIPDALQYLPCLFCMFCENFIKFCYGTKENIKCY